MIREIVIVHAEDRVGIGIIEAGGKYGVEGLGMGGES